MEKEFKTIKELEAEGKDYAKKNFQMDAFYDQAQITALKKVVELIKKYKLGVHGTYTIKEIKLISTAIEKVKKELKKRIEG